MPPPLSFLSSSVPKKHVKGPKIHTCTTEYCIYLLTTGLGTCGASCHRWECPRASLLPKSMLQVLLFVMLLMDIFPRCSSSLVEVQFTGFMLYLVFNTFKDYWGRLAHSLLSLAPWRIEWSDGGGWGGQRRARFYGAFTCLRAGLLLICPWCLQGPPPAQF